MGVQRLLYSKKGRILISIILGLGLATLFRKGCSNESCYKLISPDIKDVSDNVYQYEKKCYKYKPVAKKCDKGKKTVTFA